MHYKLNLQQSLEWVLSLKPRKSRDYLPDFNRIPPKIDDLNTVTFRRLFQYLDNFISHIVYIVKSTTQSPIEIKD